jgi:hypothetical protein
MMIKKPLLLARTKKQQASRAPPKNDKRKQHQEVATLPRSEIKEEGWAAAGVRNARTHKEQRHDVVGCLQ